MDSKLKQRVTGAVVLTALAIIILPMMLDGSAEDRARVIASIPSPPEIEKKPMTVDDIKSRMDEMEEASAAELPTMAPAEEEPAYEETTTPESLNLDQNDLPVSWSLQLGAFKNAENALRLRESLRASEFRTYVIQAQTEEGEVYRVFVGPMLQRSRLAAIGAEIESKFDLKGQIVRYRIEDDTGQLGG